jgi:hypothetical protein
MQDKKCGWCIRCVQLNYWIHHQFQHTFNCNCRAVKWWMLQDDLCSFKLFLEHSEVLCGNHSEGYIILLPNPDYFFVRNIVWDHLQIHYIQHTYANHMPHFHSLTDLSNGCQKLKYYADRWVQRYLQWRDLITTLWASMDSWKVATWFYNWIFLV